MVRDGGGGVWWGCISVKIFISDGGGGFSKYNFAEHVVNECVYNTSAAKEKRGNFNDAFIVQLNLGS